VQWDRADLERCRIAETGRQLPFARRIRGTVQVEDEMTAASELAAELHLERMATVVVHEQSEPAMRRVHSVLAVRDAQDLTARTKSL